MGCKISAPLGSANHFKHLAFTTLIVVQHLSYKQVWTHSRRAIAPLLYAVALVLDFRSDAVGPAAWIAGDWPSNLPRRSTGRGCRDEAGGVRALAVIAWASTGLKSFHYSEPTALGGSHGTSRKGRGRSDRG